VYYLTSAFYAVTRDWLRALLDAHLVMMIAAAAAVYIYARQAVGRGAAMAAMAAYIFLPYHTLDQYQRGAIAELLVFVWMPLMLLFGERLMKAPRCQTRKRPCFRASLDSARPMARFCGPIRLPRTNSRWIWCLSAGARVLRREWRGLVAICVAMALGIGLAAVYLLPAAIEQNFIHREYIAETWPYHKTYIFVHDLYNSDVHSGFFKLIDSIWIMGTLIIAVGAPCCGSNGKLASAPALKQRVVLWIILGGLASLMMTRASMPVGKLIPKIDIGVFTGECFRSRPDSRASCGRLYTGGDRRRSATLAF
jgi:hypothetical protein